MDYLRVDDPIRAKRTAVFAAWAKHLHLKVGYHTKELIAEAEAYDYTGARLRPDLYEALFDVAPPKMGEKIDAKRFGHWLDKNKDTVAAGHKLLVDHSDKARPKWQLIQC